MSTAAPTAVLTTDAASTDQATVAEVVRAAYEASEPISIVGGGTSLDFGGSPARGGKTLELAPLNRIVDYTPRDMTIVVEAGVRMAELAATLAAEGQQLPIDVPRAAEATLGGAVATNWNGPRRFGHGTVRDYVIGINGIDGRGTPFKGGGRVVKNVAGYDFCKLLTGSLGTLAVITQLALKVKPQPESTAAVVAEFADLATLDKALDQISMLETPAVAIDVLVGDGWLDESSAKFRLVVRLEGTEQETSWLTDAVKRAIATVGCLAVRALTTAQADALWNRQVEFSDRGCGDADDNAPMVLKVAVPPSGVQAVIGDLLAVDPKCTIQAHAGNGIVTARFREFRQDNVSKSLVAKLRPAAVALGGSLIVVRSKLEGLTPHLFWGGRTEGIVLLEKIKQQFDPRGILNPGRFVF